MQRRPLGRGDWLRTAQAFGRGLLYAVLLSLAALGAQHLARPLNPEWVILGFVLLLTLVVRKWPIVPHPKWWESVAATAGVFAVLLPMVLRAGASIPDALLLVVFLGAGLWQHQAERRPRDGVILDRGDGPGVPGEGADGGKCGPAAVLTPKTAAFPPVGGPDFAA